MILDVVGKGKKTLEQKLILFGVISVVICFQLKPRSARGWSINHIFMNRGVLPNDYSITGRMVG